MSNIEEKKSLTENNLSVRAGILLMIAVAVARGSSFLFSKQLLTHIEPLNLLGIRSITAFAVLMLLMLAIVCSAFGFALQPVAQRVISSETTGLLTAVNPLTTAVLGTIFLHEPFGPARLIGAILILIGIIMHSYISSNPN